MTIPDHDVRRHVRGRMYVVVLMPLLALVVPTSDPGWAQDRSAHPSFDCTKARKPFENAICHDPALSRLDAALDKLYRARSPMSPARRVHRVWTGLRRDCGTDGDCIFDLQMRSYRALGGTDHWEQWLREAARRFKRPSHLAAGGGDLGWGLHLPHTVGACTRTAFSAISDRFGGDPASPDASGTSALLENGGYVVTYGHDATLIASRPDDPVRMCLKSIPTGCPQGDDRGREYAITNLRTRARTTLPDAQHECGGM